MYVFRALCKSKLSVAFLILSASPVAALAQGSVTLYGTLDAGLLYTNKSLNAATGQNAGSQFSFESSGQDLTVFGLQGQEDLGGGLKAKFKLESGVSLANGGFDNDNGGIFGRQAWVSLLSNLGELKLGLQWSPFILALYDTDPRSMSQFVSADTIYCNNTFDGTFTQNAISYTSPKISGFTARVLYALGGVAGNFRAGNQYSASVKYEFGGFMANAAIFDSSSSSDAVVNNSFFTVPFEGRTIGAGYRFSQINVKVSFTNYKAPRLVIDGLTSGGDNNVWSVGFDYFATTNININSGVWVIKDPHNSNNHSLLWALGTNYDISKRTALYAQIGLIKNHGANIFGLDLDGAKEGVEGTNFGLSTGIIHKF